jgi:YHS domain-containing protein
MEAAKTVRSDDRRQALKQEGLSTASPTEEVNQMAIDPVCKMKVEPETAAAKAEYKGETYYFCAPGCKVAFEKNPEKYLKGAKQSD